MPFQRTPKPTKLKKRNIRVFLKDNSEGHFKEILTRPNIPFIET